MIIVFLNDYTVTYNDYFVKGKMKKDFLPPKEKSNLAEWRMLKGLTQKDLADRAGLTRVAVARIENGVVVPRRNNLIKIAAALGIALSDLDKRPADITSPQKGIVERQLENHSIPASTEGKEKGLMVYEAYELIRKATNNQLNIILSYLRSLLSN